MAQAFQGAGGVAHAHHPQIREEQLFQDVVHGHVGGRGGQHPQALGRGLPDDFHQHRGLARAGRAVHQGLLLGGQGRGHGLFLVCVEPVVEKREGRRVLPLGRPETQEHVPQAAQLPPRVAGGFQGLAHAAVRGVGAQEVNLALAAGGEAQRRVQGHGAVRGLARAESETHQVALVHGVEGREALSRGRSGQDQKRQAAHAQVPALQGQAGHGLAQGLADLHGPAVQLPLVLLFFGLALDLDEVGQAVEMVEGVGFGHGVKRSLAMEGGKNNNSKSESPGKTAGVCNVLAKNAPKRVLTGIFQLL